MQQFYELSKLCSHFKFGAITKKKVDKGGKVALETKGLTVTHSAV